MVSNNNRKNELMHSKMNMNSAVSLMGNTDVKLKPVPSVGTDVLMTNIVMLLRCYEVGGNY